MFLAVMQPKQEVPTGAIDGVNRTFTLSQTPLPYTLAAFKNGLFLTPLVDYILLGNQITYAVAPLPETGESSGDALYAQYIC